MTGLLSYVEHLECPECHRRFPIDSLTSLCVCGSPLFVIYDIDAVVESVARGEFPTNVSSMWRYSHLMPVKSASNVVSLGEGWTPLLLSRRLGNHVGLQTLMIKDEVQNPTGSFKDRGLCVAVSKHIELGIRSFALPSAGNAAISLSAYCAAAGVIAHVYMPDDTPENFFRACETYGANTNRVAGTISDCGKQMRNRGGEWKDLSTTREPYRVEGKKTIAFEVSEQLHWKPPDAIVCPTGGGTAIVGIWKGMDELEALGLIGAERPRLYAAQSASCAPVVHALEKKLDTVEPWPDPKTTALGLRVPSPFAGRLILRAIRSTGGTAIAVPEREIAEAQKLGSKMEGIDMGPEAAVGLAGIRSLTESGEIGHDEQVVLLNTGTATRYWC